MVHNAFRGGIPHRLEDADLDKHWKHMSRTGVWAVLYAGQAAWPHLRAAGSKGRFVLLTSPSGVEGSANIPVYAPVKGAQRAMDDARGAGVSDGGSLFLVGVRAYLSHSWDARDVVHMAKYLTP